MPYASNEGLPASVKSALPAAAQGIFRGAYNSAEKAGDDEETRNRKAWGAVKNAGYAKSGDTWVKKAAGLDAKIDEDRRLVFGWASIAVHKGAPVLDHDLDMVDPTDLENAAYLYNLESRAANDMHDGPDVAHLVESMATTDDKLVKWAEETAPEGTPEFEEAYGALQKFVPRGLWVGYYVDDEPTFAKVKSGERAMFSIEGQANREELSSGA